MVAAEIVCQCPVEPPLECKACKIREAKRQSFIDQVKKTNPRGYERMKLLESVCPTAVRVSTPDHTTRTPKRAWEHQAYLWRTQLRYYEGETQSGEAQKESKDRECLGCDSGCTAS